MKFKVIAILILLNSLIGFGPRNFAQGQTLSEPAFFNRCYAQIVGKPIPRGHQLASQVKLGKITALAACQSLLDKTELNAGTGSLLTFDTETVSILNNFYNFHRTWFPANTVEQIQNYNDETGIGTRDIYDTTEPGLALTRAMFASGAKYQDVLTLPTGVHALRQENARVRAMLGYTVEFPGRRIYGNDTLRNANLFNFRALSGGFEGTVAIANSTLATLPRIEVGELVGVRATTESAMIPNVSFSPLGSDRRGNEQPGFNFNFDMFKTLGGGILGTPSYVMLNYGHELGLSANGSIKLPRRWAQATMNTFLCANLPALRESDVSAFVKSGSTAPFRNASSCVMCHANLDQMAYTARNVVLAATDFGQITSDASRAPKTAFVMGTFRPEMASVAGWPSEPVENFHRQTPSGRLYFRSFSGTLINSPVNNISELGAAIAQTDDYYQCAAKRYFQFLTGIEVALYDRQDPRNVEINKVLSSESISDRVFVEKLAADLRSNQSVKKMIKSIISSTYYRDAKYRP